MGNITIDGIAFTNPEHDMVVRSIQTGSWENYSRKIWEDEVKQLTENAVVWDIGAYTGYYSLLTEKIRDDLKIVAFEPHPTNYTTLCNNLKENNTVNIIPVQVALSMCSLNKTRELHITNNIELPSGSSLHEINKKTLFTVKVDADCGDDFVKNINDHPQLVKIDVEGAEIDVLYGMQQILSETKPTILVEILTESALENIKEILIPLGYSANRINEGNETLSEPFTVTDRNYICKVTN